MATESQEQEKGTELALPSALTPIEQWIAERDDVAFRTMPDGSIVWELPLSLNKRFNLCVPATIIPQVNRNWRPQLRAVRLDPVQHAYPEKNAGEGKFALKKSGLMMLAGEAGIEFLEPGKEREREDGRLVNLAVTARAIRTGPDGRKERSSYSKEVDIDREERRLRRERLATINKNSNQAWARKLLADEAALEAELVKTVDDAMRHLAAKTETQAMLRVVRGGWLNVASTYSKEDFDKPWLVVRMVFTPDYGDPHVKQLMTMAYGAGNDQLYEGSTMAAQLPSGRVVDGDDVLDAHAEPEDADMESELLAQLTAGKPQPEPERPPKPDAHFAFPDGDDDSPFGGMSIDAVVEDENGRRWVASMAADIKDDTLRKVFLDWLSWAVGKPVSVEDCAALAQSPADEEDIPL